MDKGGVALSKKLPIFYSALLLTGVNLLLRLVGTGFGVYLSGRIGPAGVGLLQLVMSVGGFALTAGMAGVRTAAMYLTAEELGKKQPRHTRWVLSGCFTYSIVCSATAAAVLYLLAPRIAEAWLGNRQTVTALRLLAVCLPVSCLSGVMTGYFTAAGRVGMLAAVEIAEQLCSMTVTVISLALWAGNNAARACACVVLGSGVGACLSLVCLILLRLSERQKKTSRIPIGGRLLDAAVPLAVADVAKSSISTTENLIVPKRLALFAGETDPLAAFGTVCGMVFPIVMFPSAILFGLCELLIPELARCRAAGSRERIAYLVKRSLRLGLVYSCAMGALMYLLASPLCLSLYGSLQAGQYLRLYAPLAPMLYCDMLTDAMTKGLGQQKICVAYNIVTSCLDVAFLFWLLPKYGMAGYFFSFFATHLLNFLLSIRRLVKITGCRISLLTPGLAFAAAAGAVAIADLVSVPVVQGVACLVILGCLLFLFRVLTGEDLLWLKSLIAKK